MKLTRLHLLVAAVIVAVVVLGVWWGLLRDDTLSANFKNERLDKVIAFLEKETGLQIETSLDPATPVNYFIRDGGVGDALDTLALAVDGRCSLYAVVADTEQEVSKYIQGLVTSVAVPDWTVHRFPIPGFALAVEAVVLPDPRAALLASPEPWPKGGLQTHLKTLAESSDVTWAAPTAWDPVLDYDPGKARVDEAFSRLVASAKAEGRMFVYLRGGFRGGEGPPGGGGGGGVGGAPGGGQGGEGRGTRSMPDPAVIARRMEQQIASLPAADQAAARAEWDKERAFWEEVRQLPPDQRRAKMQERMDDPAVQEKIENAQADRDARRSPDKRRDRYRGYINRKQQAQSQ